MANDSSYVLYHYTPNLPCAILLAVLFALTTAFHLYQRVMAHSRYFNPFIVGGICQSSRSFYTLIRGVVFANTVDSSNHRLCSPGRLSFLHTLHNSLRNSITPDPIGTNAVCSIDLYGTRSNHFLPSRRTPK